MSADGRGIDKALQPYRGRPLIEHVIERLRPQVAGIVINTHRAAEPYLEWGCRIAADRIPGHPGPLAGLHAGLLACDTPLLACVPCDAPSLPRDLVVRLRAALETAGPPTPQVAVARVAGQDQSVFLLVRREVLGSIENSLAAGRQRVADWYRSMPHCVVPFDDEAAFHNVNTPADLER